MARNITLIINKLYPYFWHKFKLFEDDEFETECDEFVKNLREAIWVHRIVSLQQWHDFLESAKNLLSMISSSKEYASRIHFMVSYTIKDLPSIHESFLTICSLVTAVGAYVYNKGYKKFLKYCPEILEVLFDEHFSNDSDRAQIWDHFLTFNYSDAYEIVQQRTNGNPFADVVKELEFVCEIKEKINSTISVGEPPAVYRFTTELFKRYKARKSRNQSCIQNLVILKANASTQTEDQFQNTEEERNNQLLLTALFEYCNSTELSLLTTREQRRSGLGQRVLMELEKFVLNVMKPHTERRLLQNEEEIEISTQEEPLFQDVIEHIHDNEQYPDTSNVPTDAVSEVPTFDSSNIVPSSDSSNIVPSSVSSKTVPSSVSSNIVPTAVSPNIVPTAVSPNIVPSAVSPNITPSADSPKTVPSDINSKEISSSVFESSFKYKRDLQIFEENISHLGRNLTKVVEVTTPSTQPEEYSIHTVENSSSCVFPLQEMEDLISKGNSAILMENTFLEEFRQPRIAENEQNLSVLGEAQCNNLSPFSSVQPQMQLLQNKVSNQIIKSVDNQQSIPVIVTSRNNTISLDNTSRFEIENPTEENYSDALYDSKAANQSTLHDSKAANQSTLHDSKAANQNTKSKSEQSSKNKKQKKKRQKKSSEMDEAKQSLTKEEDGETVPSYSEALSLQNEDSSHNKNLEFPDKKEVAYVLIFLQEKLITTYNNLCDLFNEPITVQGVLNT